MAFKRSPTITLDNQSYTNVPAGGAFVAFKIGVGEYATPLWIQVENGPVIKVTELPFQTVLKVP